MYLPVSCSDKALRVVLNTRDDHLELLQLDLLRLPRQATNISVLIASPIPRVIGNKRTAAAPRLGPCDGEGIPNSPVCPVEGL